MESNMSTLSIQVMGVYDKLPEVGEHNSVYIVEGNLYMYTNGKWCKLSTVVTESEEKEVEERLASMNDREYFSEYHEKRIRNLKEDIKLRLRELNGDK
jgi:hypothetical protein